MDPLELVHLLALMERMRGRPEIRIGLMDGPVALNEPDLASEPIHLLAATDGLVLFADQQIAQDVLL